MAKKNSKRKSGARSIPYDIQRDERLKDPEYALTYILHSWDADGDPDEEFEALVGALEDVVKAHGIQSIAEKMDMSRDALYKIFSEHKNPKFVTLLKMLKAVQLKIAIVSDGKPKTALKRA